MRISTKGRYALRLMLDIAMHQSDGSPVRIKDIANRQELSNKYLEQIISVMNKAGFVRSIRGAQGGYLLTKEPSEYTVGMILRITEGSMSPVVCLEGEDNSEISCDNIDNCVTIKLWKQLDDAIRGVVDHVTLQDLWDWSEEGCGSCGNSLGNRC